MKKTKTKNKDQGKKKKISQLRKSLHRERGERKQFLLLNNH